LNPVQQQALLHEQRARSEFCPFPFSPIRACLGAPYPSSIEVRNLASVGQGPDFASQQCLLVFLRMDLSLLAWQY